MSLRWFEFATNHVTGTATTVWVSGPNCHFPPPPSTAPVGIVTVTWKA
jgi:hypothetical protein